MESEVLKKHISIAVSRVIKETGIHFRIVYNLSSNLVPGFGSSFSKYTAHIYYKNDLIHEIHSSSLTEEDAKIETLHKVLTWLIISTMNRIDMSE